MTNVEKIEVKINELEHVTNSYLVYDESKEAVLIDPGDQKDLIIKTIDKLGLKINYIIITHAHADHIGAARDIMDKYNCEFLIEKSDLEKLNNPISNCAYILNDMNVRQVSKDKIICVSDLYTFSVGSMDFKIIHTPGHTCGSVCIYEKNSKSLFTGDTIFDNCYGRCDLDTSSFEKMVSSLRKVFYMFGDEDIKIYPGHGNVTDLLSAKKRIKLLLKIKNKVDL